MRFTLRISRGTERSMKRRKSRMSSRNLGSLSSSRLRWRIMCLCTLMQSRLTPKSSIRWAVTVLTRPNRQEIITIKGNQALVRKTPLSSLIRTIITIFTIRISIRINTQRDTNRAVLLSTRITLCLTGVMPRHTILDHQSLRHKDLHILSQPIQWSARTFSSLTTSASQPQKSIESLREIRILSPSLTYLGQTSPTAMKTTSVKQLHKRLVSGTIKETNPLQNSSQSTSLQHTTATKHTNTGSKMTTASTMNPPHQQPTSMTSSSLWIIPLSLSSSIGTWSPRFSTKMSL